MERDLNLDGLKFLMIFCVVLGPMHYRDFAITKNIIYSFHMPVFIFLSGYFTSPTTSKEKQVKWMKKTFLIYFWAQLGHLLLAFLLGLLDQALHRLPSDDTMITWNDLVRPRYALWYLVCLIYWRWAVWKIPSKTNDILLFAGSIALALLAGFIPLGHEFTFQRAFAFLPFFIAGFIVRKRGLMQKLKLLPMTRGCAGLVLGFLLALCMPIYMPKNQYVNFHDLPIRLMQTALGFYLCLLIVGVCRFHAVRRLAKYGSYTLWIYIGHTYLIVLGNHVFPLLHISLKSYFAIVLALVYCVLFIIMANLYRHSILGKGHGSV